MIFDLLSKATGETLYMVSLSSLFAVLLGGPLGLLLYISREGSIWENRMLYRILDALVNIIRSIPYIIVMVILIPVTQILLKTMIGPTAMIFSLTISAAPFFARLVETALLEEDGGLLEAAQAMGSSNAAILFKVLLPEAMPALVSAITTMIINLIGYTAMAGALGGGGLGALAVRYGYHRRQTDILFYSVVAIVLLVQVVQFLGNTISRRINKK